MGFSERRFQDIVQCLGASAQAAREGSEKRRAGRIELRSKVSITASTGEKAGNKEIVELRDFSPRGMKFVRNTVMKRGEQFVFHSPKPGGKSAPVLCSVAHCVNVSADQWVIGAEFLCRMKAAEEGAAADAETERIRRSILS